MIKRPDDEAGLRQRAEAALRKRTTLTPAGLDALSPEEMRLALHELNVHQIELEMQNEELRDSQIALDAARARYFDLYDLAPVGYCSLSVAGLILEANLTLSSLLGLGRSELVTQPFSRFILKKDADHFYQHRKMLIETGEPQTCELQMVTHDGRSFWASVSSAVAQEVDGTPWLRFMLSDISERKKIEAALREQTEFFHLIAENVGDFIAVLDPEGRRLYNNPSYRSFFGDTNELLGTDSFAEIHPDDQERVRRVFGETVNTGQGRPLEYRLVLKDGSVHEMESHGNVIRDEEGRVERVVVVSHDVTERKQTEFLVRQMAYQDTLTKLPNRRLLDDRLSQSMAASTRSGCYGALMFLDLDNFKSLNDVSGHAVGDSLLIEAAERLKRCVREMDTVARIGGDEFVVMLSELDVDRDASVSEARVVAEKIRAALSEPYLLSIQHKGESVSTVEHRCTVSIGVALYIGHDLTQSDILKWADRAMYQAKEAGRNVIRFYE